MIKGKVKKGDKLRCILSSDFIDVKHEITISKIVKGLYWTNSGIQAKKWNLEIQI